jgi:muconolactone delta-isomerase
MVAAHSRDLAGQRWAPAAAVAPPERLGEWRTLGLFAAVGDSELETVLVSMPLPVWRTDEAAPVRSAITLADR